MKLNAFLAFLSVFLLLFGCVQQSSQETQNNSSETAVSSQNLKTFDIVASQWKFEPSTITVNKGDEVLLRVKSIDVTHGIAIPAFGINKELSPGKVVEIKFKADKNGEFPFFCSVFCGPGHSEMNGKIVVK